MKKSIYLILSFWFIVSCNQDTKGSVDKVNRNAIKTTTADIDALASSPANFKLLLDNDYVRVLEYTLGPGKKDEWHTHPAKSSYVVSGGQLKVYLENGETIMADEENGTASWMDAVGKHYVENVGTTPVKIILTEIKSLESAQ